MKTWNEPKPQALRTLEKLISKYTDTDIFQEQPTTVHRIRNL